jgi:major membrane immunogen (membrane-anchored lipoprotein)
MARSVEDIEKALAQLPQDQLRIFRAWYEKFDADAWDKQIEADLANGKLAKIADAAIAEYKAGNTKKL